MSVRCVWGITIYGNKWLFSSLPSVSPECYSTLGNREAEIRRYFSNLSALHWLPGKYRIHFETLLFVLKSLHTDDPLYISELVQPNIPYCLLRSADQLLLSTTVGVTGHLQLWPRDFGTLCLFISGRHHQCQFSKNI